jgi:hypothetical protein
MSVFCILFCYLQTISTSYSSVYSFLFAVSKYHPRLIRLSLSFFRVTEHNNAFLIWNVCTSFYRPIFLSWLLLFAQESTEVGGCVSHKWILAEHYN